MIKLLSCTLTVMILTSCSRGENDSLPVINIAENMHNMTQINLSQFAENVRYVPLESNQNNLLSWTYAILCDFSENYILDSNGRICILYDNEGNLLRQIGSQGRGPAEYTGLSYISFINEKIYIYDYHTDDLIEYSLDGSLLNRYKSGFTSNEIYHFEDVYQINDSIIFGNIENRSGQEEYKALIINNQGNTKYYFKNYIQFILAPGVRSVKVPGNAIFYRFTNKVFFKEFLNDTLFQIDNKYSLIPAYVFNFGKYKESLSDRGKNWSQIDLSSNINLSNIFQFKSFLILKCDFNKYFPAKRKTPEIIKISGLDDYVQWYNTTTTLGIYDIRKGNLFFSKPTNTDIHLFTSGFYNDIDAGPRFLPDKIVNDSTLVMKIRFENLVELTESDDFKNNIPKYPDRKIRLEELVDSLRKIEFDNPIYMFVTFKQ